MMMSFPVMVCITRFLRHPICFSERGLDRLLVDRFVVAKDEDKPRRPTNQRTAVNQAISSKYSAPLDLIINSIPLQRYDRLSLLLTSAAALALADHPIQPVADQEDGSAYDLEAWRSSLKMQH